MEIKEFCEMVEEDFLFYLYKKHDEFPFNCQTVSNLLASYLSVHFDETLIHMKIRTVSGTHGWVENDEIEIDFMNFQFSLSDEERSHFKSRDRSMSQEELISIINKYRGEYPIVERKKFDYTVEGKVCDLYGIEFARNINDPFNKKEFLSYVKKALRKVEKKVIENSLYD